MNWFEWVFDGIGTELLGIVIGLIIGSFGGGAIGYKIGVKNKIKQKQKAKNNARQVQIGSITITNGKEDSKQK